MHLILLSTCVSSFVPLLPQLLPLIRCSVSGREIYNVTISSPLIHNEVPASNISANWKINIFWITIDQLDVTWFIISLFNAQHVSNVSTSILRSLRLVVDLFLRLYCSVSICVVVTLWFGWGGVVSLWRLKQCCNMFRMLVHPSSGACGLLWIYFLCCIALVRCVLALRCGSAVVVWYPYAG